MENYIDTYFAWLEHMQGARDSRTVRRLLNLTNWLIKLWQHTLMAGYASGQDDPNPAP